MSRSTYYYKPKERPSERWLIDLIEKIVEKRPRYGYRRVTAQLRRDGVVVNHKRVQRIMRENGLACKVRRRFVRTTDSDHGLRVYPNLLTDVTVTGPNQVWVGDITYVRLPVGFCYLAVLLDLYSRVVVGYAMSLRINAELCLAALWSALDSRGDVTGCVHHSDRGVQYASGDYTGALWGAGMLISMSRKGNPYDNAYAESFMATYKLEEVYVNEYWNFDEARRSTANFIEEVYNQKRLHSALGYLPPVEFEQLRLQAR